MHANFVPPCVLLAKAVALDLPVVYCCNSVYEHHTAVRALIRTIIHNINSCCSYAKYVPGTYYTCQCNLYGLHVARCNE